MRKETLDPRINAFRPDLADIALKGRVEAARYVEGEFCCVSAPVALLRRKPSSDAALETEALCGEAVKVFERRPDGWAWAQLCDDGYVGWIESAALAGEAAQPTHRVSALRTLVFAEPDIKSAVVAGLPLGARVAVVGQAEDRNARYALIDPRGAIVQQHLTPLDTFEQDWVGVAERFLGTPYLWGGKTSLGIDCSGLVQVALAACGIAAPRDSDMQETSLGESLPLGGGLPPLRRGDLVFWQGHVGLMRNATELLHANAHHMAVVVELLAAVIVRIEARGGRLSSVRQPG